MPGPMSLPGNVYARSQAPSQEGVVMSRRSEYAQGGGGWYIRRGQYTRGVDIPEGWR